MAKMSLQRCLAPRIPVGGRVPASAARRARLCLWLTLGLALPARAETDARDYEAEVALPHRTMAAVLYYRHVSSDDKQSYSQDIGVMRYAYILRFGNLAVVPVDVVLPVADVTAYVPVMPGSPANVALRASGIGDLQFFPTVGYRFPEGKFSHTYVAFTPYFVFPTGQYTPGRPVNISEHRYSFTQELAVGQRFLKIINVEAIGNITEHTDNTEFQTTTAAGPVRGRLTQSPTYGFAFHASVDVIAHLYLAVSYYATVSGEERFKNSDLMVDTVAVRQETVHTLRFGAGIRIEPMTLLLLQYNQDIATTGDASISRFFGGRVSHAW
jgi:hypothetical protein